MGGGERYWAEPGPTARQGWHFGGHAKHAPVKDVHPVSISACQLEKAMVQRASLPASHPAAHSLLQEATLNLPLCPGPEHPGGDWRGQGTGWPGAFPIPEHWVGLAKRHGQEEEEDGAVQGGRVLLGWCER